MTRARRARAARRASQATSTTAASAGRPLDERAEPEHGAGERPAASPGEHRADRQQRRGHEVELELPGERVQRPERDERCEPRRVRACASPRSHATVASWNGIITIAFAVFVDTAADPRLEREEQHRAERVLRARVVARRAGRCPASGRRRSRPCHRSRRARGAARSTRRGTRARARAPARAAAGPASPRVEQRRAGDQPFEQQPGDRARRADRPTRRRGRGERRGRAPRAVRAEARGETYPDARLESSRCRRHARSRASQSSSRSSARCTVSSTSRSSAEPSATDSNTYIATAQAMLDGEYSTPLVAGFYYTYPIGFFDLTGVHVTDESVFGRAGAPGVPRSRLPGVPRGPRRRRSGRPARRSR